MIPKLTKEQAAVITAYTGVIAGPFSNVHEYIEKIMERPVFTHEMASEKLLVEIQKRSKQDFLALCHTKE